jgi:hypothetical protein
MYEVLDEADALVMTLTTTMMFGRRRLGTSL